MKHKSFMKYITTGAILLAAAVTFFTGKPTAAHADQLAPENIKEITIDQVCAPSGICLLADGSYLVTDTYNKVVWQVVNTKATVYAGRLDDTTITDVYGEPVGGYNDVNREKSLFLEPWAIVPFKDGYAVSDPDNHQVRIIHTKGVKTANINAQEIELKLGERFFSRPTGLAADEQGRVYVADTNRDCIWRFEESGAAVKVVEGVIQPTGLAYQNGVLYICESGIHRISKLVDGVIVPVAGNTAEGFADGAAQSAMFSNPQGVLVDEAGVIYVADTGNSAIRKIADGQVTTLIRNETAALQQFPISPRGMALAQDKLLVCDNFSRKIIALPLTQD